MLLQDIRDHPTYVINLDRRPERWSDFSKQPMLQQFKKLERFSAVDGSTLDVVNDERISIHTRHNIKNKFRRSHYEINTPGAIGASFSHITIWKNFLKSNAEYVVVFEDDTIVDEKSMKLIDELIPGLPDHDWDLWLLGRHQWSFTEKPIQEKIPKGWLNVTEFTGAHAYVLTRRGAEILLDKPYPIETHIEYYICACAEFKGLRIIRHNDLRMGYFAEEKNDNDSDTFLTRQSCPVCYIPDHYHSYGLFFSYEQMVGLVAIGVASVGLVLGMRSVKN